jgi:transposase-like protein
MTTKIDAETLRQWYVDDGMTVEEIARRLHIRKQAVCDLLAQWEIPRRRRGPRRVLPALSIPPGHLRTLVQIRGVRAVARDLHTTPDVLYVHMRRTPQPRGYIPKIDDAAVWAAYQGGATIAELMERFGCARHTIARSLRRSFLRKSQQPRGN